MFWFYSQISLPGLLFCLCTPTSLSHHFFHISNTGLPFKMQDNPLLHLNYSVSHQHPPSPSQWLFSEPHFAYQTSPFMFCPIMPLTKEEISSQARLVMTPSFPSAAFVTCALLREDLRGGVRQEKNCGCHFWGVKSYKLCCILIKGIQLG